MKIMEHTAESLAALQHLLVVREWQVALLNRNLIQQSDLERQAEKLQRDLLSLERMIEHKADQTDKIQESDVDRAKDVLRSWDREVGDRNKSRQLSVIPDNGE